MLGLNVDMKSSSLTIGQVAGHFGLPTHVLRHWESVGLLSPARVTGGRRRYTRDDLYRVASILRAKQAGLPLDEIRAFLTADDPNARKDVLRRNHRVLSERIAALQSALKLLEAGIKCTHDDIVSCPNYRSNLEGMVSSPRKAESSDLSTFT